MFQSIVSWYITSNFLGTWGILRSDCLPLVSQGRVRLWVLGGQSNWTCFIHTLELEYNTQCNMLGYDNTSSWKIMCSWTRVYWMTPSGNSKHLYIHPSHECPDLYLITHIVYIYIYITFLVQCACGLHQLWADPPRENARKYELQMPNLPVRWRSPMYC